jgi:cytochrome c biogenesis protein CcmG, thiol:disulfide interchange protein DsbE
VRRKLGPIAAAVVAAAVVVLLIYGLTQQGESRALDSAIAANHPLPAPDASRVLPVLDDVDASSASLARWRGKIVVVNFWAKWCDTCLDEAPLIEQAQRALARSGAGTVVGIDYKDVSSQAMGYVRHHGLTYPNLRDIDGSFASAYGTAALPETFVLNRRLQVVAISRGELASESQLAGWIRRAERA